MKKIDIKTTISFLIFMLIFSPWALSHNQVRALGGQSLYVSTTGNDADDCLSPANPCRTVQGAISKASSGDVVNIAAGVYYENIVVKNGVDLRGMGMFSTIIDASGVGKPLFAPDGVTATIQQMAFTNSGNVYTNGILDAGVVFHKANIVLTHCRIFNNYQGIISFGSDTFTYNLIDHNVTQGVFLSENSTALFQNNTIVSNGSYGIVIHYQAISATFLNNIIANNAYYGAWEMNYGTPPTMLFEYNDFWDNGYGASDGSVPLGVGTIYSDPKFVSPVVNNYHLQSGSSVINMGNPDGQYNDPDGTRNDIGAYHYSGGMLLSDDFSTDKTWWDQSSGYIHRDVANQELSWEARRDQVQRYYIPIDFANPAAIRFSFRFKVTGCAGNGGIYAGLVENLNAPVTIWASNATGVFVGLNDDTAFGNKVAFLSMYGDATWDGVDTQSSTLNYGGQNLWRRLSFVLNNGRWTISLMSDEGAPLGQMSGILSKNHSSYKYFMVFLDYTPGWEWETGLLDDLKVEQYAVSRSSYQSVGQYDGWVLESSETSNLGGSFDSTSTNFRLGDESTRRQYRSLLSFNTGSLPDNAVITRVTLKIRKMGVVGIDPFTILGRLKVDVRKPFFGINPGLAAGDFQAAPGRAVVGIFGNTPINNWYTAVIGSVGYPYINKTGTTQFRLYFTNDDNNNSVADYMKFFSGNYATVSARPTLIIEYFVP